MTIEYQLPINRLLPQFLIFSRTERHVSWHHRVHHASKRPNVTLGPILLLLEHFGRCVAQRTVRFTCRLGWSQEGRQPKVSDLGACIITVTRHHNILKLQITVHDPKRVQILDTLQDLVGNPLYLLLWEFESSLLHVVKKIVALHELHDDLVVGFGLKSIHKSHSAFVLAHFQHFDLTTHLLDLCWAHLLFGTHFHSYWLPRILLIASIHCAKLAFT